MYSRNVNKIKGEGTMVKREEVQGLYEILGDSYLFGGAITPDQLDEGCNHERIINKHYNVLVAENAMKVGLMQPIEGEFYWKDADKIVDYAVKNNMVLRGHTLLWHNQMPEWFFSDSNNKDKVASPDVLIDRMQTHIKEVVGRYAGKIKTWDVVNEVISDKDAPGDGLRREEDRSKWIGIIGDRDGDGNENDYIKLAFQAAHEADPNAQLIINDYNLESGGRKAEAMYNLVESLLKDSVPVHGIGMQGHISVWDPSIEEIENTIEKFADLKKYNPNFRVQITELDVSVYKEFLGEKKEVTNEVLLEQAYRYKELFNMFERQAKKGNLDMVLVWGVTDDGSWLNDFPIAERGNAPLLFNKNYEPKPAYWILTDK